jgi:hypothetical protein
LLLAGLLAACGSSPRSPFFGDDKLIVVGVDPDAEADALARQLSARGLKEARRVRGKHFTALGFSADGNPESQTDVRVISGRGIALALEAKTPTAVEAGVRYALLRAASFETLDPDHGRDEVYVARTALPSGERCLLVFRVLDTGMVDAVPTDNHQLLQVPDADPAWREPFCAGGASADGGTPADAGSPGAGEAVITPPP